MLSPWKHGNTDVKEITTPDASPEESQCSSTAPSARSSRPSTQRRVLQAINRLWYQFSDWCIEWTPFILVCCYYPTCTAIFVMCNSKAIEVFYYFYMIANFYIALVAAFESFFALTPAREARKAAIKFNKILSEDPKKAAENDDKLPTMDMVMVAYLPNEQDIVKRQVLYALEELVYPGGKLRINLVYNTPRPIEPIESELQELNERYENLRVIKVPNSKSKADNLNYFLSLPETGMNYTGIFDTDHLPHPHNARLAAERFVKDKPDIVQGRCVVYNTNESFLAKMVAIEFDKIYAIAHPGRSRMCGFGLFCGSNGWWRTEVLRKLRMRGEMLTEDIDSALRAYGDGQKAVHDLNVVSYELAPNSMGAFWKQRMRWTQGWTQASIEHSKLVWTNPPDGKPARTKSERMGLVSLLWIRELSYYLVSQHTCLILSFIVTGWPHNVAGFVRLIWFQYPFAEWFFITVIVALIVTLYCTNKVRSEFTTYGQMITFSIIYTPYLILQSTMGLYGHAREIVKYSSWNPTARK